MADDVDDLDDAFTLDWGVTPESRARESLSQRLYNAIERDDAAEIRRASAEHPGCPFGLVFQDAVRKGSIKCVRVLLELGNRANDPDECATTPLMNAAQGDLELVRLLVAAGADPNALAEDFDAEIDEDCHYRCALFWAALAGRQDVVDFLSPLTHPELRARIPELLRRRREQESRPQD
jgi:ankyrin repeat protein